MQKYPSPNGIDKVVRFSLQEGRVGAEICAEEGDTRRSLNIKRAIISLLQTEQKPSTQVDVFGSCFTEVSASQEGGATLLHRSRDLTRCAHREQGRNDFITAVYNPTAVSIAIIFIYYYFLDFLKKKKLLITCYFSLYQRPEMIMLYNQ